MNDNITAATKYEPNLQELATEDERIARVKEIITEADSLEDMLKDFQRFGVTKPLHYLICLANNWHWGE